MDVQPDPQATTEQASRRPNALVFISHDSRDAEIAEAFSRLISSVSCGVLKSFRSSDKKGNQGIEYGIEWYPEIMKKLEAASDVVCLLTPYSINRPWILFEAGVAKGKLNTPVQGIALGIPLSAAASGPFAQFQNLDDEVDSLTRLVIQLAGRIPGAEPDRDVVKTQVEAFKQKVKPLLDKQKLPQN
jgi:TIR domain